VRATGWLLLAPLAAGLAGCGSGGAASDDGFGPVFQQVTSDGAKLSVTARAAPTATPSRGVNTVRLTVADAAGAPAAGLAIGAVPFMPDMGHGASVKPTVVALGDGVYDVESLALPMAGHWTLRLTLNGPQTGAHDDAAQLSFQVP
jgi:hypothetical protein